MHAYHSCPAPKRKRQRWHPANPCEPETHRQGLHNNVGPYAMHTGECLRAWSAKNRAWKQGRRHDQGGSVGARPCDELLLAWRIEPSVYCTKRWRSS